MSYSRTLQCSNFRLELNRKSKFSFNLKSHVCSTNILHSKQTQGLRFCANPNLTIYRQRCSFGKRSSVTVGTSSIHNLLFIRLSSNMKEEKNFRNFDNGDAPLTKSQAECVILKLTEAERKALLTALQEFNSNEVKAEYEGQLAATRWRSKFGRPSKLPTLGDVDPTGSYCHLSEDWLKEKYAEKVPLPTSQQLMQVAIFNAVPFIGFGFLDNFTMIIAGDRIEETLGALVAISTMTAAALGNTISDVLGIGSAWYVELAASKIGLRPPNLSPIQLDMKPARRAANLGRAIGITIGCLLGMVPLLFIAKEEKKEKKKTAS